MSPIPKAIQISCAIISISGFIVTMIHPPSYFFGAGLTIPPDQVTTAPLGATHSLLSLPHLSTLI